MSRAGRTTSDRGSVLMLVLATLVLLMVIGMAYIVVARTERASARAMTDVLAMDRARDALMANVMQSMAASGMDAEGRPMTMAVPWVAGARYQPGDLVYVVPWTGMNVPAGAAWVTYRCQAAHISASILGDGPLGSAGNWSTLGQPYYAAARRHDYPEVGQPFGTSGMGASGLATVAGRDEPWLAPNGDDGHFSQLTQGRYSPATGTYSAAMPGAPEVAVIDPAGPADGAYDILPFSTGTGLRYRVSFRVEDESARANLNVGNPDCFQSDDAAGRYLTSYQLYARSICADGFMLNGNWRAPLVKSIHGGVLGNIQGRAPGSMMDYAQWQSTVLRYESPRQAVGDAVVAFFDLTDEMELRTNGLRGGGGFLRPGVQNTPTFMVNTLAIGAPTRNFYTTSSFSREFLPLPPTHPGYTVGGGPVMNYPRKVCFTIPTPLTRQGAIDAAALASNLAQTMEICGYSAAEARSMAINLVAYKIGYGDFSSPSHGYWLRNGPSFLDGTGIKVRTHAGMTDFAGPGDLAADEAGARYVGLSAQPFINEVVARVDPAAGVSPVDYAVELANPYPFAIDLAGVTSDAGSAWTLEIRGADQAVLGTVSLAKAAGGKIPAGGFYVVTLGPALRDETAGAFKHADAGLVLPKIGSVVLKRPIKLAENSPQFDGMAAVDVFEWKTDLYGAAPAVTTNYSWQRDNTDLWMAAISLGNIEAPGVYGMTMGNAPGGHTLGAKNNAVVDYAAVGMNPAVAFAFYDRAVGAAPPAISPDTGNTIADFCEFNRIPRLCNVQHGGAVATVLSAQVGAVKQIVAPRATPIYWESRLRFDFQSHADPAQVADPRAAALFECLSLVDRFADTQYVHQEANDPAGRYRTRIAGRINVNTAPLEVLQAVPPVANVPGLAEAIIAYRDRTGAFAGLPGCGIRSQAELFVPLSSVTSLSGATLDARDKMWSTLLMQTTVRSDSFVVYGCVEALRPAADHDNSDAQWYDPANAHQTVVARRRFLALVDRSFQNYAAGEGGETRPRILAIMDVTQ